MARGSFAALLGLSLAVAGCAFDRLRADVEELEGQGLISGSVGVEAFDGKPLVVAAGRLPEKDQKTLLVFGAHVLREPDAFSIRVPPGNYVVGAFEDADGDGHWDDNERGALSKTLQVFAKREVPRVKLSISDEYGRPRKLSELQPLAAYTLARGDVLALDDKRFSEGPAKQGMWEPLKSARESRPGLYMLQPFEPGKTPVIFVHGMVGYPQQFDSIIEGLDRTRFQPWVLFYPSGYELKSIGNFLHVLITEMEVRYELERTCLVAHSMGGLVSRKALDVRAEHKGPGSVRTLVTLASPLGGMPSAAMGVKMAPAVVPAWYDLSPGSEFLAELYDPPLPSEVEYHLLFAYNEKGADDGTVPITKQLRVEAQAEATVVRGYSATHVGILKSKAAAAQVYAALNRCRGDTGVSPVAERPYESGVIGEE